MVMKNRVISRSVIVMGPPSASWADQMVRTLQAEPSTLPKRTMLNRVGASPSFASRREASCTQWM
jgi:hypothetical protein